MNPALLFFFCSLLSYVNGLKASLHQTNGSKNKLAGLKNLAATPSNSELNITDNQDLIYIVNATISGQTFPLQLDSGSSDVWVDLHEARSIPGNASSLNQTVSYGIGHVSGPIVTAPVSFAGFDIPQQAYLAGIQVDNPATTFGAQGVLGMGFTSLSSIDAKVNATGGSWGRSLLYNIFSLNPSEPNYVAYKLQRESDNEDDDGSFTIGELLPEFKGVSDTGKIFTFPANSPTRWTFLVDKIIASGQTVPLNSVVNGAPYGQAVGLADTGTSLVFAQKQIVDAIYSTIPGAVWNDTLSTYLLSCDVEVDASVVINGRQFDIHPLDMVLPAGTKPDGTPLCAGSWRPQSFDVGKSDFDFLFGAAFMRSVYSVFDFGDFAADNQTMGQPYMKFWSLVNGSDASEDFHSIRGGVKNSTFLSNKGVNDPGADGIPHDGTGNSASGGGGSDLSSLQSSVDDLKKLIPVLFAITGLNLAILVGIIAIFLFMRSKKRRRGAPKGGKSNKTKGSPLGKDLEDLAAPESPGSFIALPRPRAPALQNEYRPLSSGTTLRDSQLYDTPKSPGSNGKFNPEAKYDPPLLARQSIAETIPEELPLDFGGPRMSMAGMMAARQSVASSGAGPFSPALSGSFDSLPLARQSMDPFSRQSAVVLESDLAGQSMASSSIAGIMIVPPEEADLASAGVGTRAGENEDEYDQHLVETSGTAIPLVPIISPPQEQSQYQAQSQNYQHQPENSYTTPPRQGILPPGSPPTLRRPPFAGLTLPEPGYIPASRHSATYGGGGGELQAPDVGRFEQPLRHSIAGNEGVQHFEPPPREVLLRGAQPRSPSSFSPLKQDMTITPPEAGYDPTVSTPVLAPVLTSPPSPQRHPFVGSSALTVDTFTPPRVVSLYDPPVMSQQPQRPNSHYELDAGAGPGTVPAIPPRSSARFSHLPTRSGSGDGGTTLSSPPRQLASQVDVESASLSVDRSAASASPSRSHPSSRAPSIAESRKDI